MHAEPPFQKRFPNKKHIHFSLTTNPLWTLLDSLTFYIRGEEPATSAANDPMAYFGIL